ncbi:MAG: hypothetical protein MPW15_18615 [Candidatus Manganitrophus sp.]|nr:hypothetical protein [Candidatus Manganitrophus sp.]
MPLIVCITEGIPVLDMVKVKRLLADKPVRLIGPNCPGVITPGEARSASCRATSTNAARSASCPASGTLTYEAVGSRRSGGLGQSTCVGIGGDPVNGTNFVDVLGTVPGRPADRGDHHDRRDRRRRRGDGRPISSSGT